MRVARKRIADIARRFVPALVAGLLAACASGPTEMGRAPPVERLAQLKPGVSTRDEVLQALGTPQGTGASRMPGLPLQDTLLYESDTMDGMKMRMKMLMVFISRDTGEYQGYMWFSAGQIFGPDQGGGQSR